MEENSGIHREEVLLMRGALADISVATPSILAILEDGDEGDEEEEEADF